MIIIINANELNHGHTGILDIYFAYHGKTLLRYKEVLL